MTFYDNIESKHLSNFVLVTIGNPIILRISTQKITFDEKYYKPILLNVPSISESLDIEQRKYKISSVSLTISDYEEDGVRFSDSLNTLINQEVVIWYASSSSKVLNEDECYRAGTYIIRSFGQNEDKVTLNCEDLSQDKLHKDLPTESVPDTGDILDKYKTKVKPFVFGNVDKSPTIIENDAGDQVIRADYHPYGVTSFPYEVVKIGEADESTKEFNNSSLFIFYNNSYVNIAEQTVADDATQLNNDGQPNFAPDPDNGLIRLLTDVVNDTIAGNLRIITTRKPKMAEQIIQSSPYHTIDNALEGFALDNIIEDNMDSFGALGSTNAATSGEIDPRTGSYQEDGEYWNSWIRVHLEDVSTINISDVVVDDDGEAVGSKAYVYFKFRHTNGEGNLWSPVWGVVVGGNELAFGGTDSAYQSTTNTYPYYPTHSTIQNQLAYANNTTGLYDSITGDDEPIVNFYWKITDTFNHINIGYFQQRDLGVDGDPDARFSVKAWLYNVFVIHSAVIKGIDKHNFFVSVIGRGEEECTPNDVYVSILTDELEFGGGIDTSDNDIEGKYAFAVDKIISSK